MKESRGFTLIELLVVITIIGIIMAFVLVFLSDSREKGRDSARAADIKQLQIALSLYFDAGGSYPESLSSLVPKHISVLPKDPLMRTEYPYDLVGETNYHLGASLEQAHEILLKADADATTTSIYGSDSTGCGGQVGRHCYDVKP